MGVKRKHEVGHGVIPVERIARSILLIRGQKVMLDEALAALYEVEVKVLNQAVGRNAGRFPADFMFQLTAEESAFLRSQFVTLKTGSGRHRKYLPYAFTEQGVAMLSSVLRSERAVRGDHAGFRALTANAVVERRPGPQAGCTGEEVRRAIQSRIRRDPRADGTARATQEEADRVHFRRLKLPAMV